MAWQSLEDVNIDQVKKLIRDNSDVSSVEFAQSLSTIVKDSERLQLKLSAIQILLIAFLMASLFGLNFKLHVLDNEVSTSLPIREVLILASSIIGVCTTAMTHREEILRAAIDEIVRKHHPKSYMLAREPFFSTWGAGGIKFVTDLDFMYDKRALRMIFGVLMSLSLLVVLLAMLALMITVHVSILIAMWTHPMLPVFYNHAIVLLVASLDVFSLARIMVRAIPFPSKGT